MVREANALRFGVEGLDMAIHHSLDVRSCIKPERLTGRPNQSLILDHTHLETTLEEHVSRHLRCLLVKVENATLCPSSLL